MHYFEILNTKTLEIAQGYAKNMRAMCASLGWQTRACKCIYRAPIV